MPGTVDESANATPWNVLWLSLSTTTFHGSSRPVPVSGGRARVSVMEPVVEGRVLRRPRALRQLRAQLADGAESLGEDVVRVDGLEIDLARVEEVLVGELGEPLERRRERHAHGVLDEARLQMRVLDDEQLVRPLQERVDRRAHRRLDDVDQPLGIELLLGADVQRSAAALVVRRQRDELEDALDVVALEARFEEALGRSVAHEPLRAGARVDARRLDADNSADAAL